ncbi:MAG: hypothetical protein O9345_08960, partial [Burkholderiaceae bacterium]|nr:hypothetical protein [Burkholderiaceae bacterium]
MAARVRSGARRASRASLAAAALLAALVAAGCGGARPTPIADRPIDLAGRCAQTEEDGFREDATLTVRHNPHQPHTTQLTLARP